MQTIPFVRNSFGVIKNRRQYPVHALALGEVLRQYARGRNVFKSFENSPTGQYPSLIITGLNTDDIASFNHHLTQQHFYIFVNANNFLPVHNVFREVIDKKLYERTIPLLKEHVTSIAVLFETTRQKEQALRWFECHAPYANVYEDTISPVERLTVPLVPEIVQEQQRKCA